ncbi:NAD(P)H-dependent oxidoreductase [Rasiella sp. SM2506]|uniref:NAD(P)H-dependent oxidoreductase n=1 Tax=Rasiella sp. SM2506 TaxID=3423914 RepID=UPI003D7A0EC6
MSSQTLQKLQWRYATKKFDTSKILSAEKIYILKEAFNLTATSYGLQPLKMISIQNKELQKKLVSCTMEQQQVADASHVLVLCVETELTSNFIETYFDRVAALRNTPKAILQPFETFLKDSFAEKEAEEVNLWMEKQAYIALGNLMTVCALEQIDACPIEGFEPEKYDELLQLKQKNLHSVLVLAVGHRAHNDMFADFKKVRRGVDEVVIEM